MPHQNPRVTTEPSRRLSTEFDATINPADYEET
jgi:hypothetical protein